MKTTHDNLYCCKCRRTTRHRDNGDTKTCQCGVVQYPTLFFRALETVTPVLAENDLIAERGTPTMAPMSFRR